MTCRWVALYGRSRVIATSTSKSRAIATAVRFKRRHQRLSVGVVRVCV